MYRNTYCPASKCSRAIGMESECGHVRGIVQSADEQLVLAGGQVHLVYLACEIDAYIELNCKDLFWINDHCTELDRLKLDDFIVSFDYKAVRLFNLIMRDRVHVKILRVN